MTALALALVLSSSPVEFGWDKAAHAGAGAALTLGGYWLVREAGGTKEAATWAAVALVMTAALARESAGNNDAMDAGATFLGLIPALVLSLHFDDGCLEAYGVNICPGAL